MAGLLQYGSFCFFLKNNFYFGQADKRAWQDSNPRIPSQEPRNILIMIGKLASILIEYEHSTGVQAFL
ncbi:MAG: hypothetical protein VW270_21005, partial [Candidatus Poseidoniales archaeon]